MQPVAGIDAVPQALRRGVRLAHDHEREFPVGDGVGEEPLGGGGPHVDRVREVAPHALGVGG